MTSGQPEDDVRSARADREALSPGVVAGLAEPPLVEAETLFRGGREILIAHRGERYRLRITQSGKLILTK